MVTGTRLTQWVRRKKNNKIIERIKRIYKWNNLQNTFDKRYAKNIFLVKFGNPAVVSASTVDVWNR